MRIAHRPVFLLSLFISCSVQAMPAAFEGTTQTQPPHRKQHASCAHAASVFRERLEPVVEAVIDGKPERSPAAAERALDWWSTYGKRFEAGAEVDSLVRRMDRAGRAGDPLAAAHDAVLVATASLDWCREAPTTADQLMRIDLFGMAAWLQAKGRATAGPDSVRETTTAIATMLRDRGNTDLAEKLEVAVTALADEQLPGRSGRSAAKTLLDLVDDAEKELLR